MQELSIKYKTALDNIKSSIQLSEELKTYLDTEEDEDYKNLTLKFESLIHELYEQSANEFPLQLEAFESYLLNEEFEGLYLPKVLGYSVLRGRVNSFVKYYRPQDHFKDILTFIINSSNFEQIKQRVGQSIQIGFALSSDIWITNIIEAVTNVRVKTFLQSQKLDRYREQKLRNTGLVKYRKQFQSLNFKTAYIPQNKTELLIEAGSLREFLLYRSDSKYNNENVIPALKEFVSNKEFYGLREHFEICVIIGLFYNMDDEGVNKLKEAIDHYRETEVTLETDFFELLNDLAENGSYITIESEKLLSKAVSRTKQDKLSSYFNVLDDVNGKGYVHNDAIAAVRDFYYKNQGLSIENEAVRNSILSKLAQFVKNLQPSDYTEYFEINKTFTAYMDVFSNQKFNQNLKELSLAFVKKCLKNFKDKRSKEYQEIKKFILSTFVEYGFMNEKQTAELFKTKRKPRKTA